MEFLHVLTQDDRDRILTPQASLRSPGGRAACLPGSLLSERSLLATIVQMVGRFAPFYSLRPSPAAILSTVAGLDLAADAKPTGEATLVFHLSEVSWTYAEERELIESNKVPHTLRELAQVFRRSEESVGKKIEELGLCLPQLKAPNREQQRHSVDALKQRDRAIRFRELAALAEDEYVAGRLIAIADELEDIAMVSEARAQFRS